ncbi:MAG: phage holin family protein [Bacteroidales bacterium]|nr:phage holin family protein [Bacteroidales bacterium]
MGFRDSFRMVLIFMLVGVANNVDVHMVGTGSALRGAVVSFYLSNENLSVLENAALLGLPISYKLKEILTQLHGREDKSVILGTVRTGDYRTSAHFDIPVLLNQKRSYI